MKLSNYIYTLVFLLVSAISFAQKDDALSLDNGTLANQFEYLTKKSSSWRNEKGQSFEVIKSGWIQKVKNHTLDSLKTLKNNYKAEQIKTGKLTNTIEGLNTKLGDLNTELSTIKEQKDNINLLGASMSKSTYNAVLFSVIALLAGLLALFIFQFKNSNVITKEVKGRLVELENEFEAYRQTALEREQKVRRQLQDEINKQRGK